jgi:ketosteroid isomerase-like protein
MQRPTLRSDPSTPRSTREGHIAVARGCGNGWRRFTETLNSLKSRPTAFHDLGDKVLVLGVVHFRGRASETEIEYPFGWVCEMRDGRLSRMTFHSSHAEALEAAGLSE